MKNVLLLLVLMICLICCKNASQKENISAPPYETTLSENQRDSLSVALAMMLNPNPQDRLQKQENQLIQLAMDKSWAIQKDEKGFFYVIQEEGKGEYLNWQDQVTAHYRGTLINGDEFDSSYERGNPLRFYVGHMIPGFAHGLKHFKVGSRGVLLIPSFLGYDDKDLGSIPAHSPLVFEIEVLQKID